MFRYYVSFSHETPTGFGILAMDMSMDKRITDADDVTVLRDLFIKQGYVNPVVLGFSPYAQPRTTTSNS
ncbi:hypothetical protein [Micromonospora sp. NPDC002717]|uniref:hypothetical protein n=1 Tax=Micromonospora sp. NPDC002717 TaxID=3154424 RepID=UPI00331DB4A8